jgi:hypothetical protein
MYWMRLTLSVCESWSCFELVWESCWITDEKLEGKVNVEMETVFI